MPDGVLVAPRPAQGRSTAARVRGHAPRRRPARRSSSATEADDPGRRDAELRARDRAWSSRSTRGERRRNPAPPFITSTLQQDASRKLRFTAKKTMMLAQQLYEGIELGEEGAVGLITYMRTDARAGGRRGAGGGPRVGRRRGCGARVPARRAAVLPAPRRAPRRPTRRSGPSSVAQRAQGGWPAISAKDQLALYRLIWERFLASQMLPARLRHGGGRHRRPGTCLFRAQGSTLKFAGLHGGLRRVAARSPDAGGAGGGGGGAWMPPLEVGERLKLLVASIPSSTSPSRRRATPRPRWSRRSRSRASAGRRPTLRSSTTIQDRGYVQRERGTLFPTELGMHGERPACRRTSPRSWTSSSPRSWRSRSTRSRKATRTGSRRSGSSTSSSRATSSRPATKMDRRQGRASPPARPAPSAASASSSRSGGASASSWRARATRTASTRENLGGESSPAEPSRPTRSARPCGKPMVIKHGRFGKFIACSGYPECKTTKPVTLGIACPAAGLRRPAVERRTQAGQDVLRLRELSRPASSSSGSGRSPSRARSAAAPFLTRARRARRQAHSSRAAREGCDYRQRDRDAREARPARAWTDPAVGRVPPVSRGRAGPRRTRSGATGRSRRVLALPRAREGSAALAGRGRARRPRRTSRTCTSGGSRGRRSRASSRRVRSCFRFLSGAACVELNPAREVRSPQPARRLPSFLPIDEARRSSTRSLAGADEADRAGPRDAGAALRQRAPCRRAAAASTWTTWTGATARCACSARAARSGSCPSATQAARGARRVPRRARGRAGGRSSAIRGAGGSRRGALHRIVRARARRRRASTGA